MFFLKPARTKQAKPQAVDIDSLLPDHWRGRVTLKRSTRAKRIALRADIAKGIVVLVCPKRASVEKAVVFALSQRAWIETQLARLTKPAYIASDDTVTLLGIPRRILRSDDMSRRAAVTLNDDTVTVPGESFMLHTRLKRFVRDYARTYLTDRCTALATQHGLTVRDIKINDTKSRWGSCSSSGALAFSWRLIHAPPHIVDYVILHELAHLKHMDHSAAFWRHCQSLCGDIDVESARSWLRDNAPTLHALA